MLVQLTLIEFGNVLLLVFEVDAVVPTPSRVGLNYQICRWRLIIYSLNSDTYALVC